MYEYPAGNAQQLNLDWVLNKIKELENRIGSSGGGGSADLEEVANALISLSYDSSKSYDVNDVVFQPLTGKLYRCNTAIGAGGEAWNAAHWDEILVAPTLTNLVKAVSTMSSDDVFNNSNVTGTHLTEALNALVEDIRYNNHYIQQKKNGVYSNVIPIEDTPTNNSSRLASSKAVYNVDNAIADKEKATFSGLGMFYRIGVIGDSYATGGINLGSASYVVDSSWINVIGRKLGIAATRYAKGGYNTRKFVNSSEQDYNTVGLGKLLSDITVKNTCGLYIFALGLNDTTLGSSYLGSISDINTIDPSQNADTFYGNTGKILSTIINNAPNSKIILSTFTRPTGSDSEQALFNSFNAAIIAIANKFAVPYIDIRTDEFFKSSYYADGIRNNHPTLDLYVGYANAIMRMCAKAIVDNNAYFYDYKNTQIYNDTYYHSGEIIVFTSVYAQFFAIANNATQLRIFIPLNKPVKATSFTMEGGFYARSPSEAIAINGTIVASDPTGNDAVFGNATVVENGIAFTLTFTSGTLTPRQVYGVATSSLNPLTLTFA